MKKTDSFQTSTPETVTISRAEYEELQAQSRRVSELEGRMNVLMEGAVAKFFFAAAPLHHPKYSILRPGLPVTAQISILGYSKADRGIFPGLPVDYFLCSTTTKLFSQNNGFSACFFAASSTAS